LNIALLDFADPADAGAKAQRGKMAGWATQVLTGMLMSGAIATAA
jgi:hypothetical protein